MFTEQRRIEILTYLREKKEASVADLAGKFNVSLPTIRADLTFLEENNKLTRTHGGAILNKKIGEYQTISEKKIINTDKKMMIAKKAIELVEENDTIALDSGTTSFALCKKLTSFNNLTLIINDFAIANFLSENSTFKLIFVGGLIGRDINSTNGPKALSFLDNINCDKAFLACESFDLKKGFSTFDENQAAFKKRLMETSKTKIMLLDSSKFDKVSSFTFSKIEDFDYLISDKVSEDYREKIIKTTKII
ncbi:MAG: DeoR/GlpR family DNA-binding transcription regulator [Anaerococcus hydrogenalis]|uniref:DeoR/GlpR family DNA-binding transcription regulator n=1 Tax=Anaerococcus hydrogenalis TaxID=33029 RepID=UPI002901BD75|nr:DeoR/GlpR family DNA-binding transcription regulator [Anaerococcus hydrogenalis]MDU2583133.1 DeoR/GlpR family DNA-binding transcription regulator [Anaerococcus hydrogenalis]